MNKSPPFKGGDLGVVEFKTVSESNTGDAPDVEHSYLEHSLIGHHKLIHPLGNSRPDFPAFHIIRKIFGEEDENVR